MSCHLFALVVGQGLQDGLGQAAQAAGEPIQGGSDGAPPGVPMALPFSAPLMES